MVAMITLSECSKYVMTLLLKLFPSYFVVPVMEDDLLPIWGEVFEKNIFGRNSFAIT